VYIRSIEEVGDEHAGDQVHDEVDGWYGAAERKHALERLYHDLRHGHRAADQQDCEHYPRQGKLHHP